MNLRTVENLAIDIARKEAATGNKDSAKFIEEVNTSPWQLKRYAAMLIGFLDKHDYEIVKKPEPLNFEEMRKVFGPCESKGEELARAIGLHKDPAPAFWGANPSFETLLRRRNQ